jgi:hypothetical protein
MQQKATPNRGRRKPAASLSRRRYQQTGEEIARYRVYYEGEIEVEANSELEAECNAAHDCRPDHCHAELIEGEEEG